MKRLGLMISVGLLLVIFVYYSEWHVNCDLHANVNGFLIQKEKDRRNCMTNGVDELSSSRSLHYRRNCVISPPIFLRIISIPRGVNAE